MWARRWSGAGAIIVTIRWPDMARAQGGLTADGRLTGKHGARIWPKRPWRANLWRCLECHRPMPCPQRPLSRAPAVEWNPTSRPRVGMSKGFRAPSGPSPGRRCRCPSVAGHLQGRSSTPHRGPLGRLPAPHRAQKLLRRQPLMPNQPCWPLMPQPLPVRLRAPLSLPGPPLRR